MHLSGSLETVGEIGSGDGIMHYQFEFGEGKAYYGIDVSDKELEQLTIKAPDAIAVRAFGEKLPFRDNFFDLLLCTETLEHFPSPRKGIAEFNRILKQNGIIIITVPNATYLRNLNLFHMLIECSLGQYVNSLPQRIIVHENMWCNAITHHHDLTRKDFQNFISGTELRITKSYSVNYPFPYFSFLKRKGLFNVIEVILKKMPIVKFWGRNLVLILQKSTTLK